MRKWVLRVIVALVLVFLGGSALAPEELKVEESVTILAKPEAILPFVVDFHRWPEWTQFNSKNDSTVQWTYSGKPMGAGSVAEWHGKELGSGRLEMLEDDPKSGIQVDVKAKSHAPAHSRIVFQDVTNGTVVSWTMTVPVPFPLRIPALGMRAATREELHDQLAQLATVAAKH